MLFSSSGYHLRKFRQINSEREPDQVFACTNEFIYFLTILKFLRVQRSNFGKQSSKFRKMIAFLIKKKVTFQGGSFNVFGFKVTMIKKKFNNFIEAFPEALE